MSQAIGQVWQSSLVVTFTNELGLSENWSTTLGIILGFSSVGVSILVATFMDCFRQDDSSSWITLSKRIGKLILGKLSKNTTFHGCIVLIRETTYQSTLIVIYLSNYPTPSSWTIKRPEYALNPRCIQIWKFRRTFLEGFINFKE